MPLLIHLFRFIPLPLLYLLAWPTGLLLYLTGHKQRHIAEVNLQLCFPEWTASRRKKLVYLSLVETCKNLFESLRLWQSDKSRILSYVRKIHGAELLSHNMHGTILIIPHLGNWEMVGFYCSSHHAMTSMYREQKSAMLDRIMKQGRERLGARLVPANTQGVRLLLKALQKNELVAILPDQNPGKGTGLFVPFFNIQTNTPILPVRLAEKTGATIILAYTQRLSFGRGYDLYFEKVSDKLYQADLELAVSAMNHELETLIRNKPRQYWWGYSRFRQRPEGEKKLYKKD